MGNADELLYPVNEMFTSVQGEGYHLGRRMTFVRFSGCNLFCSWCDTKHEIINEHLSGDAIVGEALRNGTGRCCLTGGEPLMQPAINSLIDRLLWAQLRVHVETNGTYDFPLLQQCWYSVAPKPENNWEWKGVPQEIKFVIDENIQMEHLQAAVGYSHVWLQPCHGYEGSVERAISFLRLLPPNYRLGVQAHRQWGIA